MIILSTLGPRDDSADIVGHFAVPVAPMPCRPDVLFSGVWIGGESIMVMGERKKPSDLCSSMADGSLIHKVRLGGEEGAKFQFLVIEGMMRKGADDLVEMRRGRVWQPVYPLTKYSRLQSYLLQLHYYAGVQVIYTNGPKDTASEVEAIFKMFQVDPVEHQSLQTFQVSTPPDLGLFERPSLLRLWAKELPGVGWKRSRAVEEYAQTPIRMIEMSVEEWQEIPGIGKKLSGDIVRQIHA